jgi:hypothetical protein
VTGFVAALREVTDHLTRAGVRFALIGGLAVSARTEPRFTRDADLAVAVRSDVEAEAVIRDLQRHHYEVDTVVEQAAVGRLATVRLRRHTGVHAPVLDLLFASSGIEPEIVQAAENLEILPDLRIPVAEIGHLIALKVPVARRRRATARHCGLARAPEDRHPERPRPCTRGAPIDHLERVQSIP